MCQTAVMTYGGNVQTSSSTALRVVAMIFAGVGIVLLLVGVLVAFLVNQGNNERTGSAAGTVVEVNERVDRDMKNGKWTTHVTYCPVIEYEVDDKPFLYRSNMCSGSGPETVVGGVVALKYNPANPSDAAIDSWAGRWLAPTILGGLGTVFTLIGVGLYIGFRRKKPAQTGMYPPY